MNKYLLFVAFFLLTTASYAQVNHCATDLYTEELLKNNPQAQQAKEQYDHLLSTLVPESQKSAKKAVKYTIPVVFHIIHAYGAENISKEQILDQMRILNEDFQRLNEDRTNTRSIFNSVAADCEIEFKLARVDPDGKCTEGINRVYSELTDGGDDLVKSIPGANWDRRKYMNIWVVKDISRGASEGGRVLGYATLPYFNAGSSDGIVMLSDYVGSIGTSSKGRAGRVLTHEVGHWLGLYHPFQNGCGGNCNTTGDRICDTPPVLEPSFGCPTTNNSCSNDNPNLPDQVENFMDYANGSCQNMFTNGQKSAMHLVLTDTRYRSSVVSASNLMATGVNASSNTCAPIADFIAQGERIICVGQKISFTNFSYNAEIENNEWSFEGGSPSFSTFSDPEVTYNASGTYKVTLKVSNANGSSTMNRESYITVLPSESSLFAPFTQSFDDNSHQTEGYRLESDGTYGWRVNNAVGLSGNRSMQALINASTPNATRYMAYLPPVNMSSFGNANPQLNFFSAYRQRSNDASEILIISVSEDCGERWRILTSMTAQRDLASDLTPSPDWFPRSPSDWNQQNIDLSAYRNHPNLFIRFEVMSRQGNSVYIDDINIDQFGLSVPDRMASVLSFGVYPNPASAEQNLYLTFELKTAEKISMEMVDVSGRTVAVVLQNEHLSAGDHTLNVAGLKKGVYFARLNVGTRQMLRKVIIL